MFFVFSSLDCFYAQCECQRLGFDATTTPLALLQWNSVLAVTYPARKQFGVKRGDSWQDIQTKAAKQKGVTCHAVHVALLSTMSSSLDENHQQQEQPLTLQEEYNRLYKATAEQQQAWRQTELGVRKFSTQGKACIERYRTASAVIFETVHAWIAAHTVDSSSIILERASIDEFFLDVTAAVASDAWSALPLGQVLEGSTEEQLLQTTQRTTVNVGETNNNPDANNNLASNLDTDSYDNNNDDNDNDDNLYYWRGAMIAQWIRQDIRQTLGFTLSAGIASNKTLAKLSASYGKPNGQAITLDRRVPYLLQQTQISKCRNLGGKLGQAVAALLPSNIEPTVGNIAQYLSLPQLQEGLPGKLSDSAAWVYHLAHGRDDEAVTATSASLANDSGGGGLTKSITAFKSFPTGRTKGLTLAEAADWIRLLAQEVTTRIDRDRLRNHRYPRSCNIHYSLPGWSSHRSRSVRIPFPAQGLSASDKVAELCRKVPLTVAQKEGKTTQRYGRLGLCATDFLVRESGQQGMDAFFQSRPSTQSQGTSVSVENDHAATDELPVNHAAFQQPTRQRQTTEAPQTGCTNTVSARIPQTSPLQEQKGASEDADLALARKLQASYDRENQAWSKLDRRSGKRKQEKHATKKISSFFRKR